MRYALVSDIHGNLRAWQAVWHDRVGRDVDQVICLGDLVGYGPHPAEVTAAVRANVNYAVRGNHDAGVTGHFDTSLFNEDAREMLGWTAQHLGRAALRYLEGLPYVIEIDGGSLSAACVHGSMYRPEDFRYVFTEQEARKSWEACGAEVIFVGHTHLARVDVLGPDGAAHSRLLPSDVTLERGSRYVVNVGSVGIPRAGDPFAYYCTFDTRERRVRWHRVSYDLKGFKADLRARMGDAPHVRALIRSFSRTLHGPDAGPAPAAAPAPPVEAGAGGPKP